jgi:acyl-CoA hydrolase
VEVDAALPELAREPTDDVSRAIAHHVASLIEDGDTLQTGIGAIPNAVLAALVDRRDLGVHTEMFSDGVVDLVERGVINCAKKSLHRGKLVTSFVMGTRRLYDFVDENPMVEMHPSHYVNDPFVVAKNEKMVAINSALAVDLTGQVCADSIGPRFYSGVGGQVDFIRGAARARGGRAIIALPSTAKGGEVSRIVLELAAGSGVTTTRNDVHFVVTELGVAALHGRSIRERARALAAIAHPKFRDALLAGARALHWT